MAVPLTPNMTLLLPVVGGTPGPDYALDINQNMSVLDQHDHTAGSGVPITPAAININSNLSFSNNFATSLAGLTLSAQGSAPVNTIYESGVDLYFVDGLGNNIRITQSGGIAGSPGSIANLVSPASASYVAGSKTFVWQSDTNIAANMDAGSLLLRNLTPNSTFALTLQPPTALSSNYSLTLPTLPPGQQIMTLDATGAISAPYTVDNVTIVITSNVIKVPTSGITNTQLADDSVSTAKIQDNAVNVLKILDAAVTTAKINTAAVTPPKQSALNYAGTAVNSFSSNSTVFVTMISRDLTTTGTRGVTINVQGNANGDAYFRVVGPSNATVRILRTGVVIGSYTLTGNSVSTTQPFPFGNFIDNNIGSGFFNYAIECKVANADTTVDFVNYTMFVTEN